jgi:hypothetical protein
MMMILAVHHFIDASETRTVAVSFTAAAIFPSLAAMNEFITKRDTQFKFASAFCKSNSGLRSWHLRSDQAPLWCNNLRAYGLACE